MEAILMVSKPKEVKTSIAIDKDFRWFIAAERNRYIAANNIHAMSLEDYLKEKLGYGHTKEDTL